MHVVRRSTLHGRLRADDVCPLVYYNNDVTKKVVGETIDGKPVTDEEVRRWADEAEKGFDVEELRRRGRPRLGTGPSTVIPVRMDDDLLEALSERTLHDGVRRSEAIREAVRAWSHLASY